MMPYCPKPPSFGGKLANKKIKEFEVMHDIDTNIYNPMNELSRGGPVERAIHSDFCSLREIFLSYYYNRIKKKNKNEYNDNDHDQKASIFYLFKVAFREGRLASLHSQCIPPRVDREAYVQLLYSVAISLIPDIYLFVNDYFWREMKDKHVLFDYGAFAIFLLYTLHETNVLATIPNPFLVSSSSCSYPNSVNSLQKKNKKDFSPTWTKEEEDIISTLPLGLSDGKNPKIMHRRVYHSPIRIDRKSIYKIQYFRDWGLEIISSCQECRMLSQTTRWFGSDKQEELYNLEDSIWSCICGLARDCVYIIDILQTEDKLDLCEYTGPLSVEGLAGSPDYFDHIVQFNDAMATDSISKHQDQINILDLTLNERINYFCGTEKDIIDYSVDMKILKDLYDNYRLVFDKILFQGKKELLEGKLMGRNNAINDILSSTIDPSPFYSKSHIKKMMENGINMKDLVVLLSKESKTRWNIDNYLVYSGKKKTFCNKEKVSSMQHYQSPHIESQVINSFTFKKKENKISTSHFVLSRYFSPSLSDGILCALSCIRNDIDSLEEPFNISDISKLPRPNDTSDRKKKSITEKNVEYLIDDKLHDMFNYKEKGNIHSKLRPFSNENAAKYYNKKSIICTQKPHDVFFLSSCAFNEEEEVECLNNNNFKVEEELWKKITNDSKITESISIASSESPGNTALSILLSKVNDAIKKKDMEKSINLMISASSANNSEKSLLNSYSLSSRYKRAVFSEKKSKHSKIPLDIGSKRVKTNDDSISGISNFTEGENSWNPSTFCKKGRNVVKNLSSSKSQKRKLHKRKPNSKKSIFLLPESKILLVKKRQSEMKSSEEYLVIEDQYVNSLNNSDTSTQSSFLGGIKALNKLISKAQK